MSEWPWQWWQRSKVARISVRFSSLLDILKWVWGLWPCNSRGGNSRRGNLRSQLENGPFIPTRRSNQKLRKYYSQLRALSTLTLRPTSCSHISTKRSYHAPCGSLFSALLCPDSKYRTVCSQCSCLSDIFARHCRQQFSYSLWTSLTFCVCASQHTRHHLEMLLLQANYCVLTQARRPSRSPVYCLDNR